MFGLRLLLFVLVVTGVNGWWWGNNNCHCGRRMKAMLAHLDNLEKKIETRDVAEILDLDEDYPGLEDFAAHLDTKRDGTTDKKLASLIKETPSLRHNSCHCGRALLTKFKKGLL